jgi:hypothetical protein
MNGEVDMGQQGKGSGTNVSGCVVGRQSNRLRGVRPVL